ncbi:MAG: aldehyde dehydrogenase family protein [Burkholderiales bacterium]|nr:aldehyde dehydrogenase family protein [Burkholderiales bacterium]
MEAPAVTDAPAVKQQAILEQATRAIPATRAIIDGKPSAAASGRTRPVISPIDGSVLAEIPDCDAADVERAVAGARKAFEDRRWSGMAPKERKRRMVRWAELIAAQNLELAVLETRDMGMPIGMAEGMVLPFTADTIRWYGELADKLYDELIQVEDAVTALITRAPLGVIGAILPWNAPSMIAAWKLGPALATGNSVVVKPAEDASLSTLRIAELALEAGIPEGVVQVVTGDGKAGEALSLHRDVDCLTFTGSGEVGRRLLVASAQSNMKRVHLELGGKTANIVLADAPDLGAAAAASAALAFFNQGQVCESPTRLLVQNSVREKFAAAVVEHAAAKRVGNPLQLDMDLGPIVNRSQYDSILAKIARAEKEGARLVLDGRRASVPAGTYMAPTVADRVDPGSSLAQEEVFGPVLSIIGFDTLEEAIAIANGTRYGLAAMLWSSNVDTILHAGRRLVAGIVHVNGGAPPLVELPHGGFKESGSGRDRSLHALGNYTDLRTVIIRAAAPN